MRFFNLTTATIVLGLALVSGSAMAATAHNSQAGGYGQSKNVNDSTPSSPRVKHAAKHHAM